MVQRSPVCTTHHQYANTIQYPSAATTRKMSATWKQR